MLFFSILLDFKLIFLNEIIKNLFNTNFQKLIQNMTWSHGQNPLDRSLQLFLYTTR